MSMIEKWISEFVSGSENYSDKHINEIYPGIKREEWLKRTIDLVHNTNIKGLLQGLDIYSYCVVTLNSLSCKSAVPKTLNNRSISSVICPPVIVLEREKEDLSQFQYAEKISVALEANVYYKEDSSDGKDTYDRILLIVISADDGK